MDMVHSARGGDAVKVITLRKLRPELARGIRERAERMGTSLTRAVVSLLEERLGLTETVPHALYHDLDSLAGSWTEDEAAGFDQALAEQRVIDADLWR